MVTRNIPFFKMHGTGNDFVMLDARKERLTLTENEIKVIAHRKIGVGCDQLIVMMPGDAALGVDVTMHVINADGSHAGMCGNAARCVAYLLHQEHPEKVRYTIACGDRQLQAEVHDQTVTVNMGIPSFEWQEIPLARDMDTKYFECAGVEGKEAVCVSMGNPHVVVFYDDIAVVNLPSLAHTIRDSHMFPEGVNVNIAQIIGPDRIKLRVFERGVGETLSCGSGACATLAAASIRQKCASKASIEQYGGMLQIHWQEDRSIRMTGPVVLSFTGSFLHQERE
jgi:diaminopimelate epimerase